MTVNPGWGGQPFIAHSLEKLPRVRAIVGEGVAVEVDGGIDAETAPRCREAGANVFVAGSAIFGAADPARRLSRDRRVGRRRLSRGRPPRRSGGAERLARLDATRPRR